MVLSRYFIFGVLGPFESQLFELSGLFPADMKRPPNLDSEYSIYESCLLGTMLNDSGLAVVCYRGSNLVH